MATIRKQIVLDSESDSDILTWFDAQDNASAAVRRLIREAMGNAVTLEDVYSKLQSLEARIGDGGQFTAAAGDIQEDAELAAALDSLGI